MSTKQASARKAQRNITLSGFMARSACLLAQVVQASDHNIMICEVDDCGSDTGEGLIVASRQFGALNAVEN